MASSKRFEGKTAFITGAGSGIGRATAIAFAAEGARLAVTDRGEAAVQETAEHVKAAGAEVLAITCDVSKPEEVQDRPCDSFKSPPPLSLFFRWNLSWLKNAFEFHQTGEMSRPSWPTTPQRAR
jgi:nucleoside-diphosphate-sugar epimerase